MEDFLKNKAEEYKITPKESTWAGIEAHLKQKKRRRVIWIFSSAAMLVAALLVGALIYQNQSENLQSDQPHQDKPQNTTESIAQDQTGNTNTKSNEPVIVETEENESPRQSEFEFESESATQSGFEFESESVVATERSERRDESESGEIEQPQQGPIVKANIERPRTKNIDPNKEKPTPEEPPIKVEQEQEPAPTPTIAKVDTATENPIAEVPPEIVEILPLRYADQKWALVLDAQYGSSFYKNKNINESGGVPTTQNLSGFRSNSPNEVASNSWAFSLSAQRQLGKGFFASAGLGIQHFGWTGHVGAPAAYTLDRAGNKTISDSVNTHAGVQEFVSVELNDNEEGFEEGNLSFNSMLRVTSLPVSLGYRYSFGKGFFATAQVGTQVNRLNDVRILQYHEPLNTYVARGSESQEIQMWSYSGFGSLNIEYALNYRWGLQLGFQYQHFLGSIQQFESSWPTQRVPYDYRGRMGLVYQLH